MDIIKERYSKEINNEDIHKKLEKCDEYIKSGIEKIMNILSSTCKECNVEDTPELISILINLYAENNKDVFKVLEINKQKVIYKTNEIHSNNIWVKIKDKWKHVLIEW